MRIDRRAVTVSFAWSARRAEPPVTFDSERGALAVAAMAARWPAGCDTLHLRRDGAKVEVVANAKDGQARWLVRVTTR